MNCDLEKALAPVRNRARRDWALRAALWGLSAWASGTALVMAWSKAEPLTGPWAIVGVMAAAAAFGTAGVWARRRPSLANVARVADQRMALDERLGSALSLAHAYDGTNKGRASVAPVRRSGSTTTLLGRLHADALARAEALVPARVFPLARHRALGAIAVGTTAMATALAFTPTPQAGALARQGAEQAAMASARRAIRGAEHALGARSSEAVAARAALQQALARLARARAPLAGLVDLSPLASELQALSTSATQAAQDQDAAAAAAGQALAGAPGAAPLASALQASNLKAAGVDLRALASKVGAMSPAEEEALGAALQRAAAAGGLSSSSSGDGASAGGGAAGPGSGQLGAALGEAGAALAAGQPATASRYLGTAAAGANAVAGATSTSQELAAVQAAISNAENRLAAQAQVASGAGSGQGTSSRSAAGAGGPGSARGLGAGGGVQPGAGAARGEGGRSGTGKGGNGGEGNAARGAGGSGGNGGAGSGAGSRVGAGEPAGGTGGAGQVFIGGQPGRGEEGTGSKLATGLLGRTTDYRAVLPAFEKTALEGLGTEVVAAADESLVRSYFISLGQAH
ncbi:MAG TPA: hypothetical protein VME20_06100 [Acidimicrobiales bacterium]|nr:hypothetical protein [Acidimicrobiales bacterium]